MSSLAITIKLISRGEITLGSKKLKTSPGGDSVVYTLSEGSKATRISVIPKGLGRVITFEVPSEVSVRDNATDRELERFIGLYSRRI